MAVMLLSFALPLHIFKFLSVAKSCRLIQIQFQRLLTCYYSYPNQVGFNLLFLLIPVHILFFQFAKFFLRRLIYWLVLILSSGTSSISVFPTFSRVSFCDAGNSVHSLVSLLKINCFLHIIIALTTLDNNLSIESIFEHCIETVNVLICETQWVQFL